MNYFPPDSKFNEYEELQAEYLDFKGINRYLITNCLLIGKLIFFFYIERNK